mgnify:CR=1 FL=1
MLSYKQGVVKKIIKQYPGYTEAVVVSDDGNVSRAINYDALIGPVSQGDIVIINTTATKLELGTGGYDFVISNLNRQKKELDSKGSAYYLTRGYLEGESNIWSEYLYCVSKYGEEKARKLMGIILKNYEKLSVIDTGAYMLEDILEHTKEIAAALELRHTVVQGSLHLLYKAFQGKWDEDFNIVAPGESIDLYSPQRGK